MTGTRWTGKRPGDQTGMLGARLAAQHAARQQREEAQRRAAERQHYDLTPDEQVAEVQMTLTSGTAFWNPDTGQVEVDMSGAYH